MIEGTNFRTTIDPILKHYVVSELKYITGDFNGDVLRGVLAINVEKQIVMVFLYLIDLNT